MESLNARLDAITCHLEALAASVGALRLNLVSLNRSLLRSGALEGGQAARDRETTVREAQRTETTVREAQRAEATVREAQRTETTVRRAERTETNGRRADGRPCACPEQLDREISRLRQQLAAFRFESHQEHQELYRAGRDSVVQALIEGRAPAWSAAAPASRAAARARTGSGSGSALLTPERSFTVPLGEGSAIVRP